MQSIVSEESAGLPGAQVLHDRAAELRRSGDLVGAEQAFAELATIYGEATDFEDAFQAAIGEIELSDFAMRAHDDTEALAHAQRGWTIGNRLSAAGVVTGGFIALHTGARSARAHLALGGDTAALEALSDTLKVLGSETAGVPTELTESARRIALLLVHNEGNYAVGPLLSEVVRVCATLPPPAESDAQAACGDVLSEIGNHEAAMEAYQEAIAARPEDSRPDQLARANLMNLAGGAADRAGRYGSAARLYAAALEICERHLPPDDIELLRSRYNLAELARFRGDDLAHAADELASVAASLRARPDADRPFFTVVLKNLAQARLTQGRPEDAAKLVKEALAQRPDAHRRVQLLVILGTIQRESGDEPDVGPQIEQLAVDISAEEGAESRDYLRALQAAASFMRNDRADAAVDAYAVILDTVGEPEGYADRLLVSGTLADLAARRWTCGDFNGALDALRAASRLQERSKAEGWRVRSTFEDDGADPLPLAGLLIELVLRHLADNDDARRLAFRVGTGSKRLQAEVLRRQREMILEGREDLIDVQELASRMRVQQVAEEDVGRADELQKLDVALAMSVPDKAILDSFDSSEPESVCAQLPPNSVLVEYVKCRRFQILSDGPSAGERTKDWYVAFVLPRKDPAGLALVDLGPAEAIDQAILDMRTAIAADGSGAAAGWRLAARAAAALVWDPIASLIDVDATVLIAPDGQMGALPFDALLDANEIPLLAKHTLVCIGTGRDTRLLNSRPNWSSAAPEVVGAPEFGDPWAPFVPLPAAQREAKAVASLLDVVPLLGASATRDSLLDVSDPEILHLATHGYYLPSTDAVGPLGAQLTGFAAKGPLLATGLALADANRRVAGEAGGFAGVVTALDVLGMQLFGTDLVVLSACESGLGVVDDGEGLISLARSFALAGARSVLWSLWRVDDWATANLMAGFYKRLLRATPRGTALYRAKRDMLASHPDRPDLWAAFVLQGDPLPLARYRLLLSPDTQIRERSVHQEDGVSYLDMGKRRTANFRVPVGDDVLTFASIDMTGMRVAAAEHEEAQAARALREERYDDAIERLQGALEHLSPNSVSARQLAASLRRKLAVAYGLAGDFDHALEEGLKALSGYEKLEDWPMELAQVLDNIAAVEVALGRLKEATAHYDRALAIKRQERPAGHPSIDFTLARLSEIS
ncbi:CHAT domain-containing protein [Agromyces bracchium]|uniref:CHAT domain-containing protein n=2 Tax=Agromyces bracchium TaxID=88376 RepID=UPI0018AD04E8|nr:CHAT domain-containing protein [Agromyces bracchium]